jgi:uncharacterized membrane protein YhaH (DUF805 family)
MTFTDSITTCLSKYATFKGRASRSEFWWFYLFTVLLVWGATLVGAFAFVGQGAEEMQFGSDLLSGIVNLAVTIPVLAVSSRRLHDTGRSGWWFLLAFTIIGILLLIYWWAKEGDSSPNKYDIQ